MATPATDTEVAPLASKIARFEALPVTTTVFPARSRFSVPALPATVLSNVSAPPPAFTCTVAASIVTALLKSIGPLVLVTLPRRVAVPVTARPFTKLPPAACTMTVSPEVRPMLPFAATPVAPSK